MKEGSRGRNIQNEGEKEEGQGGEVKRVRRKREGI